MYKSFNGMDSTSGKEGENLVPSGSADIPQNLQDIEVLDSSSNLFITKALSVLATAHFNLPTNVSLKDLHSVAKQNLITSTQESIARELSNCPESKSLPEVEVQIDNAGKVNNLLTQIKSIEKEKHSAASDTTNKLLQQTGEQKSLTCTREGCGRKFRWPTHFKYHQLTHCGSRQYKCTVEGCDMSFYTCQRLAVHMRTHTGERPFVCSQQGCGKSFTTAGNLQNHYRIHTGEKPFACSHEGCLKTFVEYSSLKKHMLVHSGKKPFSCDTCGKTFSQSGSRNVHRKRHHVDEENSSPNSNEEKNGTDDHTENVFLEDSGNETFTFHDLTHVGVALTQDGEIGQIVTITTLPGTEVLTREPLLTAAAKKCIVYSRFI
ncbi:zinc finger protein 143-like isoform X2 [Limulus polyphemus]|uniref:Zinc finger protein 143-like isoform X2 n=1 Tax=Limulus polyphemus TaxID=6850 RepID=A0ABM1TK13_LIMPO|nr:zinc finger protein 143-like isoform X2 [Limulus polyphemus]